MSSRNAPPPLVSGPGGRGLPRQRGGTPKPIVLQAKVDRALEADVKAAAASARVTVSQWLYECVHQALARAALTPQPDAGGVIRLRLRASEPTSITLRPDDTPADAAMLLELRSGPHALHLHLGPTDLRRLAAALERQAVELEQHTESSV